MQFIYIDPDRESARQLHAEFLEYRGVNWNLEYCENVTTAKSVMAKDAYQSLLFRTPGNVDTASFQISELRRLSNCPPILAITDGYCSDDHIRLIVDGSEDCVNRSETNGTAIMRRLRMAETRKSVWESVANSVIGNSEWLPSSISNEMILGLVVPTAQDLMQSNLRVGHIAHDKPLLNKISGKRSDLKTIRLHGFEETLDRLEDDLQSFDALLIEQSAFEQASSHELQRIQEHLAYLPSLVLTLEQSDFSAISYLERGHCDCITPSTHSFSAVELAIRKAILRRRLAMLRSITEQQVGQHVNDRRTMVRFSSNRRKHVRFFIERELIAIPMLACGAPDDDARCAAVTTDISLDGLGIRIPDRQQLPSHNWVIGMTQADGTVGYVSAYLRRVTYGDDHLIAGLRFQSQSEDFFHAKNLWPDLDPISKRFETKVSPASLRRWCDLGVLRPQLLRRSIVCPECDAMSSQGTGCSQCGSFALDYADLIHHFACAHIDHAEKFDMGDGVTGCPKCLCKGLVVGADFELIRSRFSCQTCGYQGDETTDVGCCLGCQLRFPIHLGHQIDVYGYDVERLDILALVDSAR